MGKSGGVDSAIINLFFELDRLTVIISTDGPVLEINSPWSLNMVNYTLEILSDIVYSRLKKVHLLSCTQKAAIFLESTLYGYSITVTVI